MKKFNQTILVHCFIMIFFVIVLFFVGLAYYYNLTYHSISVSVVKSAVVEYGSSNYSILKFIGHIDGDIVSLKKDLDTKRVGMQEVIVEVRKGNVAKEVPFEVEVKDTVAPQIRLKADTISIFQNENFELLSNLDSVYDEVDGELTYQMKEIVNEQVDTNYYTVLGDVDIRKVGTYPITVKAVDKSANVSTATYSVVVNSRPISVIPYRPSDHVSYVSNVNTSDVVSIASSLIGSPYVAGGNSPAGFDCSGFVQYVYAQVGVPVSRSSSTQIYDGVGVSYENAQPGDILSWGYMNGVPTHSALYIGNGKMIHATNPRQGVIMSDVLRWSQGSGTHVIAVRRI